MPLIAHVISDTNIGGAGKWLLSFLKEAHSFDYVAVVPEGSELLPSLREIGVRCCVGTGFADKSLSFEGIISLRRILARLKPDIVHCHAALSARIAARLIGSKIVYTRHSVFEPSKRLTSFPGKQAAGLINNCLADSIIAVSPAAALNLKATGVDKRKIRVVYNGVAPVEPGTVDRARFGLKPDDFVCSIIARIESYKGQEYALRAAYLLRNYPNIKFLIAGAGGDEKRIKQIKDDLSLDNVIFTGFVTDIESIERITDVSVNTSFGTEATSFSLIECMSLGLPSIVTDYGGNPFVIKNDINGIVIPVKNAKALAEAVLSLYNNKSLCAKLGEGAKRVYSKRFTIDNMVHDTEQVYKLLLGK